MAVSLKMVLIFKKPFMIPGLAQNGYISHALCEPSDEVASPLTSIINGIDIGADLSGVRVCVPVDNIAAYIYEQTAGALTTIATAANGETPGFYDFTV
jgi:hypothetical protein